MTAAPRAARAARPTVLVALLGLLALLGSAAALPSAALPAQDDPEAAVATVTLGLVSPVAPRGDDELVLRGRVTNASAEDLSDVTVVLRASRDPVSDAGELGQVAADPSYRSGVRTAITAEPSDMDLAPGQSRSWRLEVRLPDLGILLPGVYVLGAEVLGSAPDDDGGTLALARTVVPYDVPRDRPVPVALLWPLATQPGLLPNGRPLSEAFAQQVSDDEELPRLLALGAGAGAPLTWVVDPDLAESARVLAAAPATAPAAAPTDTQTVTAAAAAAFLPQLRAAVTTPGTEAVLLPYADADATTLSRNGSAGAALLADAVARARTAAAAAQLPSRRVSGLPAAGGLDAGTLAALRAAGADDALAPVTGDAAWSRTDAEQRPVVTPVSGAVSGALRQQRDLGLSARQVRQLVLAESALAALGASSGSGSGTAAAPAAPLVLAPEVRWRPSGATASAVLSAWTDAPWATPVTLSGARGAALAAGSGQGAGPGAGQGADDPPTALVDQTRPALSTAQAGRALGLAARVRAFGAVVQDSAPTLLRPLRDAALRSASASWRYATRTAAAYTGRSEATVAFRAGQVRVATPESITLSGSSGRFPLSVVNDLPVAALVRVQVRAANPDRLAIRSTPEVEVPASTTATVLVEATAAANGATPVSVQLLSPQGEPVGRARTMEVVATGYGLVGWIVIAVASAVLVTLSVVRTVRRVRARGTGPVEPGPVEQEEATAGAGRPG